MHLELKLRPGGNQGDNWSNNLASDLVKFCHVSACILSGPNVSGMISL